MVRDLGATWKQKLGKKRELEIRCDLIANVALYPFPIEILTESIEAVSSVKHT